MASVVKVLLVDDNVDVREVLTCMLNENGFQVITAEDGFMGLKTAQAEQPDLIITDIDMPHLDGIQMIARLRGQLGFREVPILVVSSCGAGDLNAALSAGADLVMQKPLDFYSFIHCVNRLLPARSA